jgi:hypothetical protein
LKKRKICLTRLHTQGYPAVISSVLPFSRVTNLLLCLLAAFCVHISMAIAPFVDIRFLDDDFGRADQK